MTESQKVALITGAGSGFGAGTAIHLAGQGYRLALNDLRSDRLDDVRQRCLQAGCGQHDVLLLPGDGRDLSMVRQGVDQTISALGQLNLLVNSAGVYVDKGCMSCTMDDYDLIMGTNVKVMVMWCREAAPHLVKTKGNIVNLSSVASVCPIEVATFYCMSKAAVDMFTKCLANELGPKGVRVNSVNPGAIQTNIYEHTSQTKEEYIKNLKGWDDVVPLKMPGAVQDVVLAVDYLASDKARFITGTSIKIDGGAANKVELPKST